jgi:hypothetical protein
MGADQPGSTSRDVSVGNSVSWPHVGLDKLITTATNHTYGR